MKKRLLSLPLVFLLIAMMFPVYSVSAASTGSKNTSYLKTNDTIVIMPAEIWDHDRLVQRIENSQNWYLSVEDYIGRLSGFDPGNGPDLRIRKNDTNIKWRVREYSNGTFKINWTNFREHESDKNWDLDGGKTAENTKVHLWKSNNKDHRTQEFYLENDNDGDPETFAIVSQKSGRYVAPKHMHWTENEEREIVLSPPYRWRIQVIDREA